MLRESHGGCPSGRRYIGGCIAVTDEGPGFPAGLEPFERFTRGDDARSGGGAGLGLALAITEAHGGHAEVAGAGVCAWLPAAP